eukprot:2887689-Rhodomonas_salina.2
MAWLAIHASPSISYHYDAPAKRTPAGIVRLLLRAPVLAFRRRQRGVWQQCTPGSRARSARACPCTCPLIRTSEHGNDDDKTKHTTAKTDAQTNINTDKKTRIPQEVVD